MSDTKLLLTAYWETLHDRLAANNDKLKSALDKIVAAQLKELTPPDFDADKFDAYCEAAHAFLAERIEMYNPLGIQYTFDRTSRSMAGKLELQLNWYDSTAEFEDLTKAAAELAAGISDARLNELADELVRRCGAFPDKSIIAAYEQKPALQKLPDYALAKAIETLVGE